MAQANILNPSQTDPMNPDYGYAEGFPEMHSDFQARGGRAYRRRVMTEGRTYQLGWLNRSEAQAETLRQWAEQYSAGFFTYSDYERARYFSGRFKAPLTIQPSGNNQWNLKGDFVELPGVPMFQYPNNWARDAIFMEEQDDFGAQLVKLSGAAWDLRTKNYALYSQDFENAVWTEGSSGGGGLIVVTADAVAAPDGTNTANKLAVPATGAAQFTWIEQRITPPAVKGQQLTFSVYLRADVAQNFTIVLEDGANSALNSFAVVAVTNAWQRFSVTYTVTTGTLS